MSETIDLKPCAELTLQSLVGPLRLVAREGKLVVLAFGAGVGGDERGSPADRAVLREAAHQLKSYFAGGLKRFDLPLAPVGPLVDDDTIRAGTDFQRRTWRALRSIPFGQTWSYAELASKVGNTRAVRAVGAANGRNPIAIVVPCHRVIGSDGSLTGYGGGLPIKQRLLELEGALEQ
jgi:methylated-DNA-[protein]-cysteine S-methyltransferase